MAAHQLHRHVSCTVGSTSADGMAMVTGILSSPDLMALDAGDARGLGKVMAQEEQAAPPVFKAGVFPLQPAAVASLG